MISLIDAGGRREVGGKAETLARLRQAGLPVLDGVVVVPGEAIDEDAITRALGTGPYAVRSSSELEDRVGASAAGLYASLTQIAADGLAAAISSVRTSSYGESVAAYLAARGLRPQPIAVLIQADVGAVPLGVAESGEEAILVEERAAGAPEWADGKAFVLARASGNALVTLVAAVERVLGGPVDIEYARADAGLLLLQARPRPQRHHDVAQATLPPGRWRLDAEHNPDPLSCAQADLVALVDGKRFGARLRVIDHYLYAREDQPGSRSETVDAHAFAHGIEPAMRERLRDADGKSWPRVRDTYVEVVRSYAQNVRPQLAAAKTALDDFLLSTIGERGELAHIAGAGGTSLARDAALYELGRAPERLNDYLTRFGAYAQAWDVAVACDEENTVRLLAEARQRANGPAPEQARENVAALAEASVSGLRARLPQTEHARFDELYARLHAAITLSESDDRVFFEAQRLVRRWLLARGDELVRVGRLAARDQIFDVPPSLAADDGASLQQIADANAEQRARAARRVPPYRIVDRRPYLRAPASKQVLKGKGLGGRARGVAVVHRALGGSLHDVPDGAVLVLPAALPSLAPQLPRLAALVTEHGGALSHAATLARELGLPAVVGCAGALAIPDGAQVLVDGESGRVLVL